MGTRRVEDSQDAATRDVCMDETQEASGRVKAGYAIVRIPAGIARKHGR